MRAMCVLFDRQKSQTEKNFDSIFEHNYLHKCDVTCIHQSVTLRKSILLNLFDHVRRLVKKEEEEEGDDIRADLLLAQTHTYRFQWYVMIIFFLFF
jgi:hypothetical protein